MSGWSRLPAVTYETLPPSIERISGTGNGAFATLDAINNRFVRASMLVGNKPYNMDVRTARRLSGGSMASDTAARAPETCTQRKGTARDCHGAIPTEPSRPVTLNSKDQY